MSKIQSFTGLIAWQKAMSLVVAIYELTAELPSDERFGLVSQMRRAAISIPSNIAEGYGRRTRGEYLHFLGISLGSTRELQTQVFLCQMLGFRADISRWVELCDEVGRLVYKLEQSLAT
jgi:four helix bundle protein